MSVMSIINNKDVNLNEILKRFKISSVDDYINNNLFFLEVVESAFERYVESIHHVKLKNDVQTISRNQIIEQIAEHYTSQSNEKFLTIKIHQKLGFYLESIPNTAEYVSKQLKKFDLQIEIEVENKNQTKIKKKILQETNSSGIYHSFVSNISNGKDSFVKDKKEDWPTASLNTPNKKLLANAQMNPNPKKEIYKYTQEELEKTQERITKCLSNMNDETADLFEVITIKWIQEAKHKDQMITITADEFFEMRGLQKQKCSATGRRGGFHEDKKNIFKDHIESLSYINIRVAEMEAIESQTNKNGKVITSKTLKKALESPAIVLDGSFGHLDELGNIKSYVFRVKPGWIFTDCLLGAGRQTALLNQKAFEYDPYRHIWEKRLTRYLSWQWRIKQSSGGYLDPYTISTLLENIKQGIDKRNPIRTRERFEKALDKLIDDKIISGWQYKNHTEPKFGEKEWVLNWLNSQVIIEPNQSIMEHYLKIKKRPNKKTKPLIESRNEIKKESTNTQNNYSLIVEKIKDTRKNRKLTLTMAAEQLNLSASQLSRIERGFKSSLDTYAKIHKWILNDAQQQ